MRRTEGLRTLLLSQIPGESRVLAFELPKTHTVTIPLLEGISRYFRQLEKKSTGMIGCK